MLELSELIGPNASADTKWKLDNDAWRGESGAEIYKRLARSLDLRVWEAIGKRIFEAHDMDDVPANITSKQRLLPEALALHDGP